MTASAFWPTKPRRRGAHWQPHFPRPPPPPPPPPPPSHRRNPSRQQELGDPAPCRAPGRCPAESLSRSAVANSRRAAGPRPPQGRRILRLGVRVRTVAAPSWELASYFPSPAACLHVLDEAQRPTATRELPRGRVHCAPRRRTDPAPGAPSGSIPPPPRAVSVPGSRDHPAIPARRPPGGSRAEQRAPGPVLGRSRAAGPRPIRPAGRKPAGSRRAHRCTAGLGGPCVHLGRSPSGAVRVCSPSGSGRSVWGGPCSPSGAGRSVWGGPSRPFVLPINQHCAFHISGMKHRFPCV